MQSDKYIILDRDGVINFDSPSNILKTADEWIPIPKSLEAISILTKKTITKLSSYQISLESAEA